MKYKLGIFGAAAGELEQALPRAKQLGGLLGQHHDQLIILTGAGPGLPFTVAKEAARLGTEAWGFSAAYDLEGQKLSAPDVDPDIFKKIIYLPNGLPMADNVRVGRKYRNVTSTAICDAGIIIAGRWGSLNEFTNLMDMQKIVGAWTGTGGVADELPALCQKITKEGQGLVIFDDDPARLLRRIISALEAAESV